MSVSLIGPIKSCVYAILCTGNDKRYIGSTVNYSRRRYVHFTTLAKGTHHNVYLQRAYDKYGPSSLTMQVIEPCISSLCLNRELFWMELLHTIDPEFGFNLVSVDRSRFVSKDTCLKIAASKRNISKETIDKWRAARVKSGYVFSEETLRKMSLAKLGRKRTPESIAKGILSRKTNGKPVSIETRQKISLGRRGKKNPPGTLDKWWATRRNSGYVISEETRKKMKEACRGRVASPSTLAKMSESQARLWRDPEYRRIRIQKSSGRKVSVDGRRRLSEAKLRYYEKMRQQNQVV